jgi:hypothetical protein
MTISMPKDKYPIVEVIWTDAIEEGEMGWNDPQETIAIAIADCPVVHSVGYVIFESDSHISLIRSWHSDGLSSVEKIPKGFIREIRAL